MSPLNRGPMLGPRMPPVGMRPMAPPRFGGRPPHPGMPSRLPLPYPVNPMFGPMRQRLPPLGPGGPPPMFGPRVRGMSPMLMGPMMGPRGMGPRGPPMRPAPRNMMPSQGLPHMRPRLPPCGINVKAKAINNAKKVSKLEELELKKPWMTDEIRSEIQKKNKLYAKAKKNKDAKEWEEFKDLRNKVTRMIRDAKTEYLAKNPEQAELYGNDTAPYDVRDENYLSSEEEEQKNFCEVCDRDFPSKECLARHISEHRVCGIEGCSFSAHSKLVEKHIGMQHSTGLYHRMKNLSSPEDIENWILERKRRYPTKANIEHLKAVESEKRQRFEVIKEKKSLTKPSTGLSGAKKVTKRKNRRRTTAAVVPLKISEPQIYQGVAPFAGTLTLQELSDDVEHSLIEDSDDEKNKKKISDTSDNDEIIKTRSCETKNPVSLCLVADYGTDSDGDNGPAEVPLKKIRVDSGDIQNSPDPSHPNDNSNHNKFGSSDNNNRRKQPKSTGRTSQNTTNGKNEQRGKQLQRSSEHSNRKGTIKRNLQLLNNLLSRSIQHERNLIAQCLKYIFDNKYFE
ncbi:nuclear fragile X mental retardation-interacting protein 1-like [Athalia rosae]|uniref:nuclear fragile X mental retardation-interacting protein 1-like n=1 Tax=Athalia rosae TaxID=37344 RepID=UPI002033A800|nr:nuclear fragile X mental retardation-interacting protein 1-like [Athalia rosae]